MGCVLGVGVVTGKGVGEDPGLLLENGFEVGGGGSTMGPSGGQAVSKVTARSEANASDLFCMKQTFHLLCACVPEGLEFTLFFVLNHLADILMIFFGGFFEIVQRLLKISIVTF